MRGFEIDKDIKLTEREFETLERSNPLYEASGPDFSGKSFSEKHNEYKDDRKKLEAKLEYLKKLKRYKWIFNK